MTHPSAPVYETSFTLGVLGLDAAKAMQRGIHTVPANTGLLPPLVGLVLINAFVVSSLTWVFMPVLTRMFRFWLRPRVP